MSRAPRLDPLDAPLDGISLIEANAGTGKTWTITALYLRLLLEAGRSVEAILVVTFTEIATAELRERLRSRLVQARAAFQRGWADESDALLAGLLARIGDHAQAVLRITAALRDFDQAPVYTIHAFCQRVLADRAFESGMPFESEILADETLLLQEIADDFWRRTFYTASPLFVRCALERKITPEYLRAGLSGLIGKPYLQIRKPAPAEDLGMLEEDYGRAYAAARALWREGREAITAQLAGNAGLSGNKYRADRVASWLEAMGKCLAPEAPGLSLFERFEKFTPRVLADGTRKGATPPSHPFYEACEALKIAHTRLQEAYKRRLLLLRAELLEYANAELATRKQRRQLVSYDDLLLNLDRALRLGNGEKLAAAIRERYKAALIDEFQDTDAVQYRIFRAIYLRSGLPVFLVGDPKQSIYSFRGADVFAYLDARRDALHHHTLDVNWRSQSGLLAAVNALFEGHGAPFVIPDIGFVPSQPAPGGRGHFIVETESGAPLELWFVAGDNGKRLNKDIAAERIAQAAAAEIARLLRLAAEGRARIALPENGEIRERPLAGGDVAVLVRTHRQGRLMRDALRRLGVASVERGGESVFATREAEELQRLLTAIAEPGRDALLRAALTTEMMGLSGAALCALGADEAQWEKTLERFRSAHDEWHEGGFIRMARRLFRDFAVIERLLAQADGERRVTNVLHLVELLHREAAGHGIGAALEWFSGRRRSPGVKNEEELLRLESDQNLVKILTVHAAKGLEFPLVFCPFLWDGRVRDSRDPAISFHDPSENYAAVVDLGSDAIEEFRGLSEREKLAENLRLLYVALTRARYRCWMAWGNINEAEESAPAWLLHHRGAGGTPRAPLDEAVIRADLERLERMAEGRIRVRAMPCGEAPIPVPAAGSVPAFAPRNFPGEIRASQGVTSFSALAHARAADTPDYDAGARPGERGEAAAARDIHAFPRGARTGRCFHAIFEAIDFSALRRPQLQRVVTRQLAAYDFPAHWAGIVADMVEAVVATPLDDTGALRLVHVSPRQRLNEVEFHYPIAGLSDGGLRAIFLDAGFPDAIRERIGTLAFAPAQGYMKGYIDLVFEAGGRYYLADYKSNWLGPSAAAYRGPDLYRAMAREAYYLQYLVYCIALHRYLRARLPGYDYEAHFGGVRYLFVRGMSPQWGCKSGVFADRPALGLVEALDSYLQRG